jgi:hypothetical protein
LNGDEWLLTHDDTETHILNVYEQLVAVVNVITLNSRQYCVICDPVVNGKPQLGKKVDILGKRLIKENNVLLFYLEIGRWRNIVLSPTGRKTRERYSRYVHFG